MKEEYKIGVKIYHDHMTILPEVDDTLRDLLCTFPDDIKLKRFLGISALTVLEWLELDDEELDNNAIESGFYIKINFIDEVENRKYKHIIMFDKGGQSTSYFNEVD